MLKNNIKNKVQSHLKEIMVHDVEAAAFLIVSVSLIATFTSFALDKNRLVEESKIEKKIYNPQTVRIVDLDNDGFNDMIITHADGHVEHSYSVNK
jgi:hypothetical protein